ncbi:MAG: hypothetical protein DMF63_15815 [Acidobacteria bacterium]|nr:MAG: hypothetical protein DMF63_15815 [Acidobacteriota bacterium]
MKRLILAISVLLVLGLAAAAIAYNRTAVAETAMSCCCCAGDSCPMKDSASGETASCCNEDCCKDGSCAMKKDAAAAAENMPADCPMMKNKTGEATAGEHQPMHTDSKSCSCACCKAKQNV